MADTPKEAKTEAKTDTKSGIYSPAGYNGKAPANINMPVKDYPGSSKLGDVARNMSIDSPAKDASYNGKPRGRGKK